MEASQYRNIHECAHIQIYVQICACVFKEGTISHLCREGREISIFTEILFDRTDPILEQKA